MMSDILSQDEIDALLGGGNSQPPPSSNGLSSEEIDALGEIGNISMGTAATTLYTLLNNKVTITTPEVTITSLRDLAMAYPFPFVAVEILYTQGLEGNNLLIINEEDVKIITDLMMGGDGSNIESELSELHLSAIGEVMNQMIGSSSTSLAQIFNKSINISPPKAFIIDFTTENPYDMFESDEPLVKINFKMQVGDIINSHIMQLLPISFAKGLVDNLLNGSIDNSEPVDENTISVHNSAPQPTQTGNKTNLENYAEVPQNTTNNKNSYKQVDVQPVSFQSFDSQNETGTKENINLILDVPLQVSVELGKTKKLIKEILELSSGSIIELDKMAGEPVDVLVNGKMIAKGEVVVIDDSFGVRITDIISPIKRISNLK